ncbi:OmpA family protein [Gelidibacter salicanalis]|uniref:OmpA family protein n=1 Tax=Gelidibacter salicanalis TaxID=291193 RepID=A0A934KUL8_9FLAO|nr:OmpA family protein [Gelidibacter salicanalis]MBJ7881651.1 OmpA family protein [Gelidibacter salicanalis]
MKNKITTYSFFLFLLCFSNIALLYGQENKMKKAAENYEQLNYVNAQKIYLDVAAKGYKSEELFTKLANSYYFNAEYDQAVIWYERLFDFNANPDQDIVYLRYSQALKATGQPEKAAKFYDTYVVKNGTKMHLRTTVDYEKLIQENSGRYDMKTLERLYHEGKITFGQFKQGSTLYFASTDDTKTFYNRRSAWDGLSFLSLYTITLDSLNQAQEGPKRLKANLQSKFHESTPVISADGNTMYFTRSNTTSATENEDQKLKIYKSVKSNDMWQDAEELSINSDYFSSAHPALSPDGKKLYFSSDRPGGFGESDLYVSAINSDGSVGAPVNLGYKINTRGKETFPFVSAENELYFSSDGHFGLGGLDVFYVKIADYGYGNLNNVGQPVNSYADDFAFGIDFKTKRGFISSNRSEKIGEFVHDNVYTFLETAPIVDLYAGIIEGTVTDKQTELPLQNALVTLTDPDDNMFRQVKTDSAGYYIAETNKFDAYLVRVTKDKYDADEVLSKPNVERQEINFQLQPNEVAIETGIDLSKVLNIPMIYFDFDKANIRQDAKVELEKVLAALNQYPQLNLEIRAHTDSRGNDAYNQKLSQRRATATLKYLVDNGVSESRLSAIGMGETNPVNKCTNGVRCSRAEHQKNRRSEFIIKD